jgi:hypothetical protein
MTFLFFAAFFPVAVFFAGALFAHHSVVRNAALQHHVEPNTASWFCVSEVVYMDVFQEPYSRNFCNRLFEGTMKEQCAAFTNLYSQPMAMDTCLQIDPDLDSFFIKYVYFMMNYHRTVSSWSEWTYRYNTFVDNYWFAMEQNANENHTYTLGITPFSDKTFSEFESIIGYQNHQPSKFQQCSRRKYHSMEGIAQRFDRDHFIWKAKTQHPVWWSVAMKHIGLLLQDAIRKDRQSQREKNDEEEEEEMPVIDSDLLWPVADIPTIKNMQDVFTSAASLGIRFFHSSNKSYLLRITGCIGIPRNDNNALVSFVKQAPVSVYWTSRSRSLQLYTSGIYNNPDCNNAWLPLDNAGILFSVDETHYSMQTAFGSQWGENGVLKLARDSAYCKIDQDPSAVYLQII